MKGNIIEFIESIQTPTKLKNPLATPFTGDYFQYFHIQEIYNIQIKNKTRRAVFNKGGIYPSPYVDNLPHSFKFGDSVEINKVGWRKFEIKNKIR